VTLKHLATQTQATHARAVAGATILEAVRRRG